MASLWQTGSPLSSKFLVETTKYSRQAVAQHLHLVPYGLTHFRWVFCVLGQKYSKSTWKFIAISTWSSEAHGGEGELQMLPQQSHKSDMAASRARQLRRSTQPPPSQGGRVGISCRHLGVWPPVKYGGDVSELRRRVAAQVSRRNVTTSAFKCHDFIISSPVGRRRFLNAKLWNQHVRGGCGR